MKLKFLLIVPLGLSLPLVSYAEAEVTPFVSITTVSDSNLYRLDEAVDETQLSDGVSKTDTIYQTAVGLDVNWKVNRQKILLNAFMVDSRFDKNQGLDNLGQSLESRWDWLFGSHLSGVLSYDREVTLSDFANTSETDKSERTQDRVNATARWRYHPDWRIGVNLRGYNSSYDTQARSAFDNEVTSKSIELDYLANSGSRLGLRLQTVDGRLPNREVTGSSFIDNRYEQNSVLVTALWNISGKSRFDADFGLVSRRHPNIVQRDYDGVNVNLKFDWFSTSKLVFSAELFRKIVSSEDLLASYSENTGVNVSTIWSISDKLSLNAQVATENRDYSGNTGFINGVESTLEERYDSYSLGLRYQPHRNFDIGLSYSQSSRDSSRVLRDYSADIVSLNLTVKL